MTSSPLLKDWINPLMKTADKSGKQQLGTLFKMIRRGEMIVPEYQRGRVWSEEQKSNWVGYVLSWMPLPAIFIRQVNTQGGGMADELLDGQQRIFAMMEWTQGKFGARIPWSGEGAWCESVYDAHTLERLAIPCVTLPPETTDADAIGVYIAVNTAGTPHTPEEIQKARDFLRDK